MKQKFDVIGMTCSSCSSHVDKSVKKLNGINDVNVNLLQNTMVVDFDENKIQNEDIIKAVIDGGYNAKIKGEQKNITPNKSNETIADEISQMKYRMLVSFGFLIPLMYISMGHMMGFPLPKFFHGSQNALTFAFTQLLLTLPILYVNKKYYKVGFKTLFKGSPNMDSLIAIGSSAAVFYGIFAIYNIGYGLGHNNISLVENYSMDLYFESAAMILALITFGKYLETKSKGKTSDAITKLMDLSPKKAFVVRDEMEIEIPIEEVIVGDIVIVKPGQSIPVDGIIVEGSSAVDESALTGESIPVEKHINDKVIGATINKSGYFKFKALKVGNDTALAQIIQLVEDASSSKAPIAKLADKVSGIFVPIVITIAVVATIIWLLLGYPFSFALSIGIAVLVISCPCALGLATPTAIMVGTGKGAENGILIKSAESLETAHTINTVVLDKTGTITEGKPKVTDIILCDGVSEKELLTIAASIEKSSEHPLADAIVEKALENKIDLLPTTNFNSIAGEGISSQIENKKVLAGNLKMMTNNNITMNGYDNIGNNLAQKGKTPLYFSCENKLLGVIAVADTIKKTSKAAIEEFTSMGIDVIMLTGDNKKTAEAIRQQLGITRFIAEVLPQDKEREIRNIQAEGKKVAMIGDGINDAPALARADVGIAIGAGTDVAIESADIVLMKSDLLDAVAAVQLSKAVIKNIKENLFWAFFYNAIGIPLAAGVFYSVLGWKLNPMFGAAAMSLSSVCVVSNALRLKMFKPKYIKQTGGNIMKKTITIEGMTCNHCTGRVQKALSALDGVEASVDLETKSAFVTSSKEISDEILKKAVVDAGYEVISIQ